MSQTEHVAISFNSLGIRDTLLSVLNNKGFNQPTPIQHQIIPHALEGKDVIGIAQTGTGKTLAFGIPMIQHIALNQGQGLVLVPTRELAQQVDESLNNIGRSIGLRTALIIGGAAQGQQIAALKRKPHIVIATPGRLADLMEQGRYKLSKVNVITLDEADRMLDIGFLPQIKQILKTAPTERQTMLFSATMPSSISALASSYMKLPLRIEIAPQGTSSEKIEQEVIIVPKHEKMRLLESVLTQYIDTKVLIFSRTKHGAKKIANEIREMGHTATEIHSNRTQTQRVAALQGFTKNKFRTMVATDIAARGIDVKDIGLVINFDLPENSEDYVHRIGRTGRAGRDGKAISFVTPAEKYSVKKIERLIRKTLPIIGLPELPPERERVPFAGKPERTNRPFKNKRRRVQTHPTRSDSNRNYRGRSGKREWRNK